MRRALLAYIPLYCLSLMTGYACARPIDFQEILSVDVPDLRRIEQFDFGDINHDGYPEILTRDDEFVILYSYVEDSVLFSYPLGWLGSIDGEHPYAILLSDINRDRVPDIAIGAYIVHSSHTELRLFFYDGTGFEGQIDTSTTEFPGSSAGMIGAIGITLFDAVDFDGDSYPEFIFSIDSSGTSGINTESIHGVTNIFASYPDSIVLHNNGLYLNPISFPEPYSQYTGMQERTGTYTEFQGYWRISYTTSFCVFNGFEPQANAPQSAPVKDYLDCNRVARYSSFTPYCIGDIDTISPGIEVLAVQSETSCCLVDSGMDCGTSSALRLYTFVPPDQLVQIWSKSADMSAGEFFFLPESPGCYYGFSDDSVYRFNGSDGSLLETVAHNLHGVRTWGYPFASDDRQQAYLITTVNNTISVYKPSVSTDVEGGEDNPPLPITLELGQPYPNPFNAVQTIPVRVGPNSPVNVAVYDILGRRISELYNGVCRANSLRLEWRADRYASGVYFIKASSGDETSIIKSILLK